jgi:hypothetical protein
VEKVLLVGHYKKFAVKQRRGQPVATALCLAGCLAKRKPRFEGTKLVFKSRLLYWLDRYLTICNKGCSGRRCKSVAAPQL